MSISKIKINYFTYVLMFLFLFSGFKQNLLCIFTVFIIHELGHLFFCKLFKIYIIKLEIYPFGGILKINKLINYSILKSIFISSGGLIFQLLLCLINSFIIKSRMLDYYNNLIFFMNIIPVIPLDGSKIMHEILTLFVSFYLSKIITYLISFLSIIIIVLYFYINGEYNLFFIIFSLSFLIKEIMEFAFIFNRFLLERYLYDFKFKRIKKHRFLNLKKLHLNQFSYFYQNGWKDEKYFLAKRFDKNH